MSEKQYTYAVARIRSKELNLLNGAFMEQLLSAKSVSEALTMLAEKGWQAPEGSQGHVEDILSNESAKTWDTVTEMVDDKRAFDVFLLKNDYHNLKAAIKEACTTQKVSGIYVKEGTVSIDVIREAAESRDFSKLEPEMKQAAEKAMDTLLHTRDGQLCDIIIDQAALTAIKKASDRSENKLLKDYGELTCATADIKIALRASATKKDPYFLEQALAPCDTLDIRKLSEAAVLGQDEIMNYLQNTDYADAVPELKKSASAFEKWCDDKMIREIRPELYHPFTIGPLAAYILARESEISSVRIILNGKANDLPEESIRERIRETYV